MQAVIKVSLRSLDQSCCSAAEQSQQEATTTNLKARFYQKEGVRLKLPPTVYDCLTSLGYKLHSAFKILQFKHFPLRLYLISLIKELYEEATSHLAYNIINIYISIHPSIYIILYYKYL